MDQNGQQINYKDEAKHLLRSFLAAVATAAGLAALNWIGAHIPAAIQFLSSMGAAYATSKHYA